MTFLGFSITRKSQDPAIRRERLMQELLDAYKRWMKSGDTEAAEAYMLLIHNFSRPKEEEIQQQQEVEEAK